ncbi:autotransporter assembly complex protein TamA [Roseiarcus sp.]|uniref:autotransporter assembly complex protein TamA n=1 Tax=Roseiarcus sp. TaxID=1969460 RepID=UPI003F990888
MIAAVAAAAAPFAGVEGARAFDVFGLFGSDDTPPPVSKTAIAYKVTIDVKGGDGGVKNAVMDASSLYTLRKDAPPDGDALARRATNDFGPIIDALWGLGYYNATVAVSLDRASLTVVSADVAAFARTAESYRNRAAAPVTIRIDPGPMFRLGEIRVVNGAGEAFPESQLPARAIGLKAGDPAAASALRTAEARIVDYFRNQGRPLAKVLSIAPVVNHATETMDVTFFAAPGPVAPFGEASLVGPKDFSPAIARSFLYIEPGDPYSPKAIEDARTSLREIPAVGGVRITESPTLDALGRLPYEVDVEDRLPYSVGASAQYSTYNGPAGQVYWEDRNVFGGAERLRLQADVFYAPPWYVTSNSVRDLSINDLGGRIKASFLKPALWGTRNDFLFDALGEKMSTSGVGFVGYQVEDADAQAALRHRFSQNFWIQAGVEGQNGVATDSLGRVNYTLIGVPVSANYDTTDNKLDPTTGVRLNATASGFGEFLGSTLNLAQFKARGSAYYSIDPDSRFVLAGRIGLGAESGPDLDEIPANWRFYSGGGGSVRGYAYDSLGPRNIFGVVGGRSLFEASAELRIKITDTIGIVPFFDAGNAFASNFPNFSMPLYEAAGLGFRYYTAIGPIRLDVAFPFQRVPGSGPVAVYISIGQAF